MNVDIKKMTAADAIRQAVIIGGKTQEEIEEAAQLRPGSLDQYCSRRDPHWPNMLHIPSLSVALGTDLLIRWQMEQYLQKCLRHELPEMDPAELLKEVVRACSEVGDVCRAAQDALKNDDGIDRKEALAIRREAMEVVSSMFRIINGVAGRV